MSPARSGRSSYVALDGEQLTDVGGEVAGDVVAQVVHGDALARRRSELLPSRDPEPDWRVGWCTSEPAALVMGADLVDDDVRVAEPGAAEHHLKAVDQRLVAAPVRTESAPLTRGFRRRKVRRDVATAERIDGLLGVADQHQRAVTVEGGVDHLPLHRIGVLELVDHHHRPTALHPLASRGVGILQRGGQPGQQVVVPEDAEAAFAALQLGQDGLRELDPDALRRGPVVLLGHQPGVRVADDLEGELQRGGAGDGRLLGGTSEAIEVDVVDDLGDKLSEVVDQGDAGVGVTGDAERTQYELAELVSRRDGGRVEVGQGVPKTAVSYGDVGSAAVDQVTEQTWVVAPAIRIRKSTLGVQQLGADAFTKLLAGGAAEGDQQHLVQTCGALGDVAGDQPGEGIGLAGAGARLQHSGARRQWTQEVEGLHHGAPCSKRSIGSQTRFA